MPSSASPCLASIALERIPAVRWATKVDIYHGLVRGRAFLAAEFANGATLKGAADAACMSPFHFNRLFRALFRQSPHEYLTSIRLYEAKRLLRTTEIPINNIAVEVGFLQPGSFTRRFRQRYGLPPRSYRRQSKILKLRKIGTLHAIS